MGTGAQKFVGTLHWLVWICHFLRIPIRRFSAGGLTAVAAAGWAAGGLPTVGWAAAGGLGMVQLAAGRGGAARHAAGGQAGVLHTAVRAAPSGAAAHSSTATTLATASATAGPTPGPTPCPTAGWLAAAGLAAGWLAAAGLAAAGATGPTGTAGESTEAGVAAGHGVRGWAESGVAQGSFCVRDACPTGAFYRLWPVSVFVTIRIFILLLFKEAFQGPLIVQILSSFKCMSKLVFPCCSAGIHQMCSVVLGRVVDVLFPNSAIIFT